MFSKTWAASNDFTAFVKLVGLPSMKLLMMIKTWVLFKGFATLCTFIRLLFSVNSLMSGINPKEYQIVRTHTKETAWIQDLASPNHSSTLCRMPHLNNKQNKNTNPIISRQEYHLTQPSPSEEKQTNKNSAQISPYMKLKQATGPALGQKPKGRKNSTLFKERIQLSWKTGKSRPQTP